MLSDADLEGWILASSAGFAASKPRTEEVKMQLSEPDKVQVLLHVHGHHLEEIMHRRERSRTVMMHAIMLFLGVTAWILTRNGFFEPIPTWLLLVSVHGVRLESGI